MEIKEEIIDILAKEIKLKREEIEQVLEIPPQSEMGDFSLPCFKLAAKLKKNPLQIAEDLKNKIKIKEPFEKIEAKNGYLNIYVIKSNFAKDILEDITDKYGESKEGKGKKIVVDFSGPNVGKPMHIGHIRSTIIGDSLIRTFHYLGYEPIGINYLGDIGLHIGKLIVAYELWLDKKTLKEDPIKELLRLYVKFCDQEKSEAVEGQDEETEQYADNPWTLKAKEKLKLIELGDKKAHKIWEDIRKASQEGFNRVYDMLNVNFYETTGQSKFGEDGKGLISVALKKGIAKPDESGAIYVEFPEKNLPKKFVLRSNGTASYITQDIGAAVYRNKKYKFDEMIYVTDVRQQLHFQQLFEILRKFGYDFSSKCKHVGFGTINFGGEILATRAGNIILLEDVLNKTTEKAKEEIKKRKTKGDPEKIGVGAIKYAILRSEPARDINFSWEQALNFEGDTGPYLQYAYARASSIIKKAKGKTKEAKGKLKIPEKLEPSEIELLKKLGEFPKTVQDCARNLNPSIIAHYSFQLSQTFNDFYTNCKVIGAETKEQEQFRIKLVDSFRKTLKNSLYLLGIDVMDEM